MMSINLCQYRNLHKIISKHVYASSSHMQQRGFAQLKKTRKSMSPEDVRKAQMSNDPSGLLKLALQSEEDFYQTEGGIDLDRIQKESAKENVDDLEEIRSTYSPVSASYSPLFDYDAHKAWYSKKETMTIDRIFYIYEKPDGTQVHIREGANARCNAMIEDMTANEIIRILKKPNLFRIFPEELLEHKYSELMAMTKELFEENRPKEAKRIQYARRLLQHWWLNIKGKPPLKVESSIFI